MAGLILVSRAFDFDRPLSPANSRIDTAKSSVAWALEGLNFEVPATDMFQIIAATWGLRKGSAFDIPHIPHQTSGAALFLPQICGKGLR